MESFSHMIDKQHYRAEEKCLNYVKGFGCIQILVFTCSFILLLEVLKKNSNLPHCIHIICKCYLYACI